MEIAPLYFLTKSNMHLFQIKIKLISRRTSFFIHSLFLLEFYQNLILMCIKKINVGRHNFRFLCERIKKKNVAKKIKCVNK